MISKRQSQEHPHFLSGSVLNGLKVFPLCFLICSRLGHRNTFQKGSMDVLSPVRVSWTLQASSFLLGLTILLTSSFEILWTLLFSSFWRISVHFSVFAELLLMPIVACLQNVVSLICFEIYSSMCYMEKVSCMTFSEFRFLVTFLSPQINYRVCARSVISESL